MPPVLELLDVARGAATAAAERLLDSAEGTDRDFEHTRENLREVKARADAVLDREIVVRLRATGIRILSEEAGELQGTGGNRLCFIVDPLDGTFNFVKSLGPCAVSIALWNEGQPVFGVVYRLDRRETYWGGENLGAFQDGVAIHVSAALELPRATLCTGFPARFDTADPRAMPRFWHDVSGFGKVRMIGSAAVSLLHVATGAADAYIEREIMLWDVAAGIPIVQGAGGRCHYTRGIVPNALNVRVSNGRLREFHESIDE